MLKTLLKKQLAEIFKSWIVNRKTGKGRSKAGVIGLGLLFAFLMLFMLGMFFLLAWGMGGGLFGTGMEWLYFALFGAMSILLGTIGSVFNTYAGLYLAKDNDLLISMPIPPRTILASRLLGVYLMSLLYSALVWLPAQLCWWIWGSPTVLSVVFGLLLTPVIALFVTVLTCLLGWLVALLAGKLKNRSFVIVLLSLVFVGLYYTLYFRMSDLFKSLIAHSEQVGAAIRVWGNLLYQLGRAACGRTLPLLIFTGVTLALAAVTVLVLSRSFLWLATRSGGGKKAVYRVQEAKQQGVLRALLGRERRHFTSSAAYMLNCGLGLILLPAAGVFALVKRAELDTLRQLLQAAAPAVPAGLPLIAAGLLCAIVSMNFISTPSVSLEGKSLWIVQSLPVTARQVLDAKLLLHVLANLLPAIVTPVLLGLALRFDALSIVLLTLVLCVFVWLSGLVGLRLGVKKPSFNWTNETTPIKQSLNPLLVWLLGTAVAITIPGLYFLLGYFGVSVDPMLCLGLWLALLTALSLLSQRWLDTKGAAIFDAL